MQWMELIIYYDREKRSGQIETEMDTVFKSPLVRRQNLYQSLKNMTINKVWEISNKVRMDQV